ncbi:hypothetical protein C1N66_12600 [Bacillus cereus]|uniref:Phage protein n=1 Tax=Bacillus cereus TaxID=1396 RepID=A0AB73UID0_BACCE|nr:hypothetical protein [Bacillus cereus]QHV07140.1 hypothetical protein C1N82_29505 [Bacillus cereus]QHV43916.1 hypothetical protein C1N66_12600 [Bacillus cereus]
MANNKLIIEVTADTTEALEGIKEVKKAANECVEALEKLEKVMGKFTNKKDSIEIEVPVLIKGKQINEVMAKAAQLAGFRIGKNI